MRIFSNLNSSFDFYCNDSILCKIRCLQVYACSQMRLFCNGTGICAVECNNTNATAHYDCPIIVEGNYVPLPTQTPTLHPSTIPTPIPTAIPSSIPTTMPTTGPAFFTINLSMNAGFGDDYTTIVISFDIIDIDTNVYTHNDWKNTSSITVLTTMTNHTTDNGCTKILSLQTRHLLSDDASCQWVNGRNQNSNHNISLQITQEHLNEFINSGIVHIDPNEFSIIVTLSGYSQIMINDSLFLNADIFENIYYNSNTIFTFNYTSINGISTKSSILNAIFINTTYYEIETQTSNTSIIPQIVVENLAREIGPCDDLILDARNSYNLGMFLSNFG